jgi:hypothetical protein
MMLSLKGRCSQEWQLTDMRCQAISLNLKTEKIRGQQMTEGVTWRRVKVKARTQ